ncbi:MAG TPA: DUF4252 domain-containing protein [Bacteroidales bacterium]|nr:DUF4252 domain-containing protein [Bacteroidales bacterium]
MKRMVFAIAALAFAASLSAQRLSADEFFNKYSGRDGYTTVEVSGSLLGILGCREDDTADNPLRKITSIRVLVREKDKFPSAEGFIPEIRSIIKRGRYEELMTVRDSDTDLRFMVRSESDMVREILLVVDGDDEAVIQIEGNLTRDEASRLFQSDGKGLSILEGLEISGD